MLESPSHLAHDAVASSIFRKTATDPTARSRLHVEAAALGQCAHPGVVALIDVVDTTTTTELQLRRHGTRSLADGWPSDASVALDVLAQTSSTVADMHSLNMVHGRLEPSHVLLDDDDRPVLGGFAEAAPVGAPAPAPSPDPAHPAGLPRTAALDVHALGGLLVDALTAMAPTERRAEEQQRARLRAMGHRCLQPDVSRRPTASELSDALVRAALVTAPGRDRTGRGRRRSVASLQPARTIARCAALVLATLCTVAALIGVDRPALPGLFPLDWPLWIGGTALADMALAGLWLTATALASYLALASTAALVSAIAPGTRVSTLASHLVPRSMEALTGVVVGAGLLSALGGQFVTDGNVEARTVVTPTVTTSVPDAGPTTTSTTSAPTPTLRAPRATMPAAPAIMAADPTTAAPTTLAPSASAPNAPSTAESTAGPVSIPATTGLAAVPPLRGAAAAMHVVDRGEHLWSIANNTIEDAWGREPTQIETAAYWQDLVAENRSRLVDPDNPDLIFRGQELALPPVPVDHSR
jgi:hypothetical protein